MFNPISLPKRNRRFGGDLEGVTPRLPSRVQMNCSALISEVHDTCEGGCSCSLAFKLSLRLRQCPSTVVRCDGRGQ
jgi:hypothetical protein